MGVSAGQVSSKADPVPHGGALVFASRPACVATGALLAARSSSSLPRLEQLGSPVVQLAASSRRSPRSRPPTPTTQQHQVGGLVAARPRSAAAARPCHRIAVAQACIMAVALNIAIAGLLLPLPLAGVRQQPYRVGIAHPCSRRVHGQQQLVEHRKPHGVEAACAAAWAGRCAWRGGVVGPAATASAVAQTSPAARAAQHRLRTARRFVPPAGCRTAR